MTTPLRLLSVQAGAFGRDRAALGRAMSAAAADVACVHGGPHLLRWRSISAAISRRAGLVVVTGGRPAGANLLLSSLGVDVVAARDVRLAAGSPLRPPLRPPGAALAALRRRAAEFVLVSASLTGNAADRLEQARRLEAEIGSLVPADPPAIISVEGANRTETAAWQWLVENRVGVAGRIFVDGRITVVDAAELAGGSTLVVNLEL